MKKFVCCLLVVSFLAIGCGSGGTLNVNELNAIRGLINVIDPSLASTAQNLDLGSLSTIFSNVAQTGAASGQLTTSQAAALASPTNQALLTNLFQLIQGGSAAAQKNAASGLVTAAGGTGNLSGILSELLTLFQSIGPVVAGLDPTIAPYIDVALAILPLVEGFFGGASASH
jgi:hypothetical protein